MLNPKLVAGETLNYTVTAADYPASDGWAATLYLNPRGHGSNVSATATASGDDHVLQITSTNTAALRAGAYGYEIWASKGAERYRIEAGQVDVLPSLLTAAPGRDHRSDAQKALDQLRAAWLAFTASGNLTIGDYMINGRRVVYRTVAELRAAINAAERDVLAEKQAADIAAGLGGRQRFVVRM